MSKTARSTAVVDIEGARKLAKEFHGRGSKREYDAVETSYVPSSLAELGALVEIVLDDDDGPVIDFEHCRVKLCSEPDGTQYYFIGGDQELTDEMLEELEIEPSGIGSKSLTLGEVYKLTYETDKQHLDDSDGETVQYEHEFGEEGGEMPTLVYNPVSKRLSLVGGSYETKPEGITN